MRVRLDQFGWQRETRQFVNVIGGMECHMVVRRQVVRFAPTAAIGAEIERWRIVAPRESTVAAFVR
jgi:hypothetical protein